MNICIAGESGTGKTTSIYPNKEVGIKGLNPKTTVYINVANKSLPFRGWKKQYTGSIDKGGNYLPSDNAGTIANAINYISNKREDITDIVIDDFQYIMAFEFMDRAKEIGYNKFTDIGVNASKVITAGRKSNKRVWFLWHPEIDKLGGMQLKTVGEMVRNYFNPEGLFSTILFSTVIKEDKQIKYKFVTNRDGQYPAKSPIGMFDLYEPNDLGLIVEKMEKYENE